MQRACQGPEPPRFVFEAESTEVQDKDYRKKLTSSIIGPARCETTNLCEFRYDEYPDCHKFLQERRTRIGEIAIELHLRRVPIRYKAETLEIFECLRKLWKLTSLLESGEGLDSSDQDFIQAICRRRCLEIESQLNGLKSAFN